MTLQLIRKHIVFLLGLLEKQPCVYLSSSRTGKQRFGGKNVKDGHQLHLAGTKDLFDVSLKDCQTSGTRSASIGRQNAMESEVDNYTDKSFRTIALPVCLQTCIPTSHAVSCTIWFLLESKKRYFMSFRALRHDSDSFTTNCGIFWRAEMLKALKPVLKQR